MPASTHLLSVSNHDRDRAGLRYVYPVVSRRAGGVSIGINLNPNNACNWACIYCQVPMLTRGGPPPLDISLLEAELNHMLDDVLLGDFMQREVPDGARRLMDIAFSGNGEPTGAPEFADAVALVVRVMQTRPLQGVKLRLITNGSLLHRPSVQQGIQMLGKIDGEVWFKVDAVDENSVLAINGVNQKEGAVLQRLRLCAALAPTWVQTCMMAIDGTPPTEAQLQKYLDLLQEVRDELRGVLLYGLARPSMQPGASRLTALSSAWMHELGERINALGLPVKVSP
ncbi:MAG TPA: radical SAM protein [Rhodocyclaceae bacterium]|nr:radical SAM protein [Rhodocyclaceae bacterium]